MRQTTIAINLRLTLTLLAVVIVSTGFATCKTRNLDWHKLKQGLDEDTFTNLLDAIIDSTEKRIAALNDQIETARRAGKKTGGEEIKRDLLINVKDHLTAAKAEANSDLEKAKLEADLGLDKLDAVETAAGLAAAAEGSPLSKLRALRVIIKAASQQVKAGKTRTKLEKLLAEIEDLEKRLNDAETSSDEAAREKLVKEIIDKKKEIEDALK